MALRRNGRRQCSLQVVGTSSLPAPSTNAPVANESAAAAPDNNRRQGLSIASARRVQIIDCEFMNTGGTAPSFGIDLEPNARCELVDHIVILSARTTANVGGAA